MIGCVMMRECVDFLMIVCVCDDDESVWIF